MQSGTPRHTHVLGFAVKAVQGMQNAVVPMAAAYFSMRDQPWAIFAALGIGALIGLLSAGASYLGWRRLTYTVGAEDIRVESGILSRAARSVPYERIQDVSIEQGLIPRLFGLVQVKFETGAGGKDDLALSFLTEDEGERLREVIKARKDDAEAGVIPDGAGQDIQDAMAERAAPEPAEVLFAMDEKRLLTFGLFEFSLAVFAVLAGLFQYAETFASVELWDPGFWEQWLAGPGSWISTLGPAAQILGLLSGLITLVVVGSATGLVRTVLRDWGFVLERTPKGFRRRRGLLTKTDVVMPERRVQAITMTTGFIRRRFGWHGLKFVSLAQDSGSASHDVAPFAKPAEIAPIARAAGFAIHPADGAHWHRGSRKFRFDSAVIELLFLCLIAAAAAIVLAISGQGTPLYALIIAALGLLLASRQMFLWRFDYNALDPNFLFIKRGWLAPKLEVASRVKLQSVEISQGPIARRRGYATLKLGLAGGTLQIEGLPLGRARELRAAIVSSIGATDFSELGR